MEYREEPFVEVFHEVAKVNAEALNIKFCQPWQKHCRGNAEAMLKFES